MRDPLGFAAMMVRQGDADGTIGGAVATTADTVRAALQIVGRARDSTIVSSYFLMMLCEIHHSRKGAFIFADCGLVVEPDSTELAEIAMSSARSYQKLIGEMPRVPMLPFPTGGSTIHSRMSNVAKSVYMPTPAD